MLLIKTAVVFMCLVLMALNILEDGQGTSDPQAEGSSDKSRKLVEAWLQKLAKGKAVQAPPKVAAVDGLVHSLFPDDRFYTIQFMRYPRAVKPPAPLKLENVVRVRPDGSVERIESLDALKKLFEKKVTDIREEAQARAALLACLRLAEEFYQDGYYTFSVPEHAVSVVRQDNHLVASGKAVVTKGGKGEVRATLTTGTPGKVEIEGKVRPDVRLR